MALDGLKIDIINDAYSQLRISGITVTPSPEDVSIALDRLELLMNELNGRSVFLNYFFEDTPDSNTPHNVDRKYLYALAANLALRLCANFGKEPTQVILGAAQSGMSFIFASTAVQQQTNYPSRQPIGNGNSFRFVSRRRFYPEIVQTTISCVTIKMDIGDIDDFTEHYEAFLRDGETLSTVVVTADTGLTVSVEVVSSPDFTFRVTAVGPSPSADTTLSLKLVATTSLGRKETRLINFELTNVEL